MSAAAAWLRRLAAALCSWGFAMAAAAQEPALSATPLPPGHRLRLSGALDDPAWRLAPVHERFWQVKPASGLPAPVLTRVRVLYDAQALYFGIEAHDPDVQRIRAPQVRRDKVQDDQDHIAVLIDALGAGRSALLLRVNAAGALADGVYTAATHRLDFSPDFDIDSQVQRDAQGYRVELRVPFSALRFDADSTRPWRVLVLRSWPRDSHHEMASAALTMDAGSRIERMNVLEGLSPGLQGPSWSWRPTLSWHGQGSREAGQPEARSSSWQAGLDLSWRSGGRWVLDATLKPDFSQVELDIPQLSSNSQFPLQLPEKRRFFLESSDLLEAPSLMSEQGGGGLLPLYTRSISQPRWGLRASYRDEEQDSLALLTQDQGGAQMLLPGSYQARTVHQPGSDLGLWRYRRHLGASSAGLLAIDRRYAQGRGRNAVLGADWIWRSDSADRVRALVMASHTDAQLGAGSSLQLGPARRGSHVLLDWLRKSERWEPSLSLQATSEGFRNDSGFTAQNGFRQLTAQLQRKNRREGFWTEINPYVFLQSSWDWQGRQIRHQLAPGVWLQGPHDLQVILELHPSQKQRVQPSGRLHALDQAYLEVRASPSEQLSLLQMRWTQGNFVDLASDSRRPGAAWLLEGHGRLGAQLELEARTEWTALRAQGQRLLLDRVDSLLLVYHHDARSSLRLIALRHRSWRRGLPGAADAPPAADEFSRDLSLTASRRLPSGLTLYLGWSGQRSRALERPHTRQSELFVKGVFEI